MRYRVFVTGSGIAEEAKHFLEANGCVLECGDPCDTPDDIARKLSDFRPDGLIVRQGKITEVVLKASPNLVSVCKYGVGTDNIDIASASKLGISVFNTPGTIFESVAEHTVALILSLLRQIPYHDKQIRSGIFEKSKYVGQELLGRTLGLIGFGRIGRRVAELVAPFNMNILVYHPSNTKERLPQHIRKLEKIEELLSSADIISLHCPLCDETRGMINANTISRMRRSVYIINTARGAIIDEADLLQALKSKQIAGAALDTFEIEPPGPTNALYDLDNVIFSPHIAGISDRSFRNTGLAAARNILAALRGETLDAGIWLNPEAIAKTDSPTCGQSA